MLNLGRYNDFTITRFTDHGAYVDGGDLGEILIPKAYVKPEWRSGTPVRLFLYLDQSERLVATSETPLAQEGDFAHLRCTWVNEHGAFLDWGLLKDLFVPFREQKRRMEAGRSYLVHILVDPESQRLIGTAKIERYLQPAPHGAYHRGEQVSLLVWQRTELGLKVIVENTHVGLIYNSDLPLPEPRAGAQLRGTVVTLRPDGRLDLSLQRIGKGRFRDFAQQLLHELRQSPDGRLPYTDRSDSADLQNRFSVSKKTFKRAVGTLYAQRLIALESDGLRLLAPEPKGKSPARPRRKQDAPRRKS